MWPRLRRSELVTPGRIFALLRTRHRSWRHAPPPTARPAGTDRNHLVLTAAEFSPRRTTGGRERIVLPAPHGTVTFVAPRPARLPGANGRGRRSSRTGPAHPGASP